MRRALAALTLGAFATIGVDLIGAGQRLWPLVPSALFAAAAIAGFQWVARRGRAGAYAYVVVQMLLGFIVFVGARSYVGATLFLVVLVSQSVLLLPWRAAAVVVGVVPFYHVGMAWRDGLREGLGLLAAGLFTAFVTKLLMREQRSRAELAEAHRRLREYAVQAEGLAVVRERNRVARDIHDGLGHSLTVVQMQIKAARAVLAADAARADAVLSKAQSQAETALRDVRRSVGALREPESRAPLPDALRALAEEASAAGVPTGLDVVGEARPLAPAATESLYRAAQEGLTNVRKHAAATRADLTLDYTHAANVRLEVRDDGTGVSDVDGARGGFGLLGIEERTAHAGGTMTLESLPGKGYTLRVEVPG
ncbi:two-component sensor histidine kinase [Virgisporangium aliadipatigenens]|uniref:histidine kinase n=1 Tax=Virgisporangium aliadipatigenens TaxID=741659 RepID=A0A8J3YUZ0_9ACTN|nr:sensor histidine kinase [Virgisporangium aliadipatigenens]GIJ50286.1 two-component sensor histidine kinase [Virgisporangium aliadipatigenens]